MVRTYTNKWVFSRQCMEPLKISRQSQVKRESVVLGISFFFPKVLAKEHIHCDVDLDNA